jgi:hypothetical protein
MLGDAGASFIHSKEISTTSVMLNPSFSIQVEDVET